jgi:hypothetical protein
MDVFRVTALGLSPRFAAYNVVGGLLMALIRTGPELLFDLKKAREIVGPFREYKAKDGMIAAIDPRLSTGSTVAPEMATKLSKAYKGTGHTAVGKTYAAIWDILKGGASWNFSLNSWVDDVYRSATMLYGERAGLRKGMSADEARYAGVELSNKVLQDWDAMLPWERKILRNVFPFYGWLKHILTYTMTLPFDHPLRVSIVSSAIANELEDQGDPVLGTRFNSIIWWGGDGPYAEQWTANLGGLNPFNDVADSLTWAGFVSQLSPLAQGGLEMMGVDVVSARPSLYPQATYDPETGRLVAQGKGPLESMAGAFVPQSEALMQALGLTESARSLAKRDPEAARVRIMSALGIPGSVRKRNYSEEVGKAESARDTAATDAVNRAMRSGEWADASRYPQAYVDINKKRPGAELVDPALLQEFLAQRG